MAKYFYIMLLVYIETEIFSFNLVNGTEELISIIDKFNRVLYFTDRNAGKPLFSCTARLMY